LTTERPRAVELAAQGGDGGDPEQPAFAGVAGNSVSVATWTLVSRLTGFARVAVIAAVLGPTFFGNLFQATNLLPNVTYEFLTGSLFASLLVPALVRHVDAQDRAATERLAGGFMGVATLGFALIAVVVIALGPVLVGLLTLGVQDATIRAAQLQAGWPLVAMLMPQVILYGLAGTGVAVQNAHGRFALAAAAPALENVGVIVTLLLNGIIFGTGTDVTDVTTPQLLLIGLGTTAAVGLHAGAQWWGARRVGITLIPRAGWRDPEVRKVVRLVVPSLGYAGLSAARLLGILVVAGSIPGGVVAFQMAMNFFHLPVAIAARPVASALLPRLARLHQQGDGSMFRDEWVRGVALSLFLAGPAALAFVVLAEPLAAGVSFGEMATPTGVTLVAASVAALGFGVVGDANFVIGTHASYARLDARSPLLAMALRTAVTTVGMVVAFLFAEGVGLLVILGLAVTVSDLSSAAYLGHRLRRRLSSGAESLLPSLWRIALASAVMVGPAYLVSVTVARVLEGPLGAPAGIALGAPVGLLIYLAVQRLTGSRDLANLRAGFGYRAG
jgi:putative peptidoglycan lipid II flippase